MLALSLVFAYAWLQAGAKASDGRQPQVNFARFELHLTSADGAKSLGQLAREQSGQVIPDKTVTKIHFSIDALSNALIFPSAQGEQHPDFQFGIRSGDDKIYDVPNVKAKILLDNSPVKTVGVCNFVVQIDFDDHR